MIFTKTQLAFLTESFKILGGLPVILFEEQKSKAIIRYTSKTLLYLCIP